MGPYITVAHAYVTLILVRFIKLIIAYNIIKQEKYIKLLIREYQE